MLTKEELKQKADKRCRHFNGIQNKVCESKIQYPSFKELPCFNEGNFECEGYNPLTPEEQAVKDAEFQRHIDLMRKGLSSCCEAPFDTSRVITSGPHKNHGPRTCSKCQKMCFWV